MVAIIKLYKDGDWNEDLDAQLAAMLVQGIVGQSVLISWDVLKSFLVSFFEKLQGSPDSLAEYVAHEVPILQKQLEGFGFELERFVERVKQTAGD